MKRKTRNCCMAVLLLAAILLCGCMKRVDNQDSAIFVQDAAQTGVLFAEQHPTSRSSGGESCSHACRAAADHQ